MVIESQLIVLDQNLDRVRVIQWVSWLEFVEFGLGCNPVEIRTRYVV